MDRRDRSALYTSARQPGSPCERKNRVRVPDSRCLRAYALRYFSGPRSIPVSKSGRRSRSEPPNDAIPLSRPAREADGQRVAGATIGSKKHASALSRGMGSGAAVMPHDHVGAIVCRWKECRQTKLGMPPRGKTCCDPSRS
jgi:hypothetical protein